MIKVIWRSDPIVNPIGLEARILEIDGDKTLEVSFARNLSLSQKLRAIWSIITNKEYVFNTIYGDMPNE